MAKASRYATLVQMLTLCRRLLAGWTETHVLAAQLGVDRVTVLRYLATLRAAGLAVACPRCGRMLPAVPGYVLCVGCTPPTWWVILPGDKRREEDSGRAAYRLTKGAWRAWGEG